MANEDDQMSKLSTAMHTVDRDLQREVRDALAPRLVSTRPVGPPADYDTSERTVAADLHAAWIGQIQLVRGLSARPSSHDIKVLRELQGWLKQIEA